VIPARPIPNLPVPTTVRTAEGMPAVVDGERVVEEIESWIVEDRWWAEAPIRRRYWELVMTQGRCVVVFHDLESGCWFKQAA
jgi:hypothetical protein